MLFSLQLVMNVEVILKVAVLLENPKRNGVG